MRIKQLIFILSVIQILGIIQTRELVMTQVMFRHGARYSMHGILLKNDPERDELVLNRGQLTEVGMRQLYLLGKKIRKDYITDLKLIDEQPLNRQQIHIQSSNVNRTLQSASSFMAGLFPIGTGSSIPTALKNSEMLIPPSYTNSKSDQELIKEEFPNNTALPQALYPYPIHSLGEHDHILNPPCPGEADIKKQQSEKYQKRIQDEIDKYADEIKVITNKLNIKGNFVAHNMTKIQDVVYTQKFRGIDYGITDEEFNLLMYLKAYVKSLQLYTYDYSRLITSPLFEYIFMHFENKIKGKTTFKMIIESTHDSQIMPMMVVLGLINSDCLKADYDNDTTTCQKFPPFASNFVFELYKINEKVFEIQVKYNGNYIKICGDKTVCKYDEFKDSIIKKIIPIEDYENQCGLIDDGLENIIHPNNKPSLNTEIPNWIITILVILIIVIIGLLIYIKKMQNEYDSQYQKFKNTIQL